MEKRGIINKLKKGVEEISENSSLIYAGIVGSFREKEDSRDIDILLLFNKLDAKQYKVIIDSFSKISKKLTNKNHKFIVEERNGPFKPSNKKVIQFHLIVQDKAFFIYTSKVAQLSYIEWTFNNSKLFGKNIFSLFPRKDKITKEIILNSKFGSMNSSIKLLKGKLITYYSKYEIKNGRLKLIIKHQNANSNEKKDFLRGVVKANVRNFTKYMTGDLSPNEKIIDKTSRRYLLEIYPIYNSFLGYRWVNKNNALKILYRLKNIVEEIKP